ncbi:XdhC family aldehyde oxidoreductase maturation factor [Sporomusa sp.]|jgi:xanthine dehydrogenase accessory factor|uniref:XdhC family aldehyde oxidoreductase maturation factor n=1 Tax=Sporomusa sp. TaxID=2078658 RepID=UPI002C1927BA|nr:XdhC family protein [Sporomusa sp.]HWR09028.1 XdhC family protein [Sporomusa sp.]
MKRFYQGLIRLLAAGENIVVATIFNSSGSAPRSAGAKMIIQADGSITGTVGGGRLEAETIELAHKVHKSKQSLLQKFDLTGTDAAGVGMICGGAGEILVDYIDAADESNRQVYEAIITAIKQGKKAWLITELAHDQVGGQLCQLRQQCLVQYDGTITGRFKCEPEFMLKLSSGPAKISIHADAKEDRRFIVEPIRSAGVVYLFGAGHVSQQIARLTDMAGFKTIVIDDRPAFANKERFPLAEIIVIDNFAHLPELAINSNSYLVIVTRGHLHDKIVLEQALQTEAAYIGMIGSKKKRDLLFSVLQAKGYSSADLIRVYSPIGINIEAETPEEIAVSIVAELIKVRAERENVHK